MTSGFSFCSGRGSSSLRDDECVLVFSSGSALVCCRGYFVLRAVLTMAFISVSAVYRYQLCFSHVVPSCPCGIYWTFFSLNDMKWHLYYIVNPGYRYLDLFLDSPFSSIDLSVHSVRQLWHWHYGVLYHLVGRGPPYHSLPQQFYGYYFMVFSLMDVLSGLHDIFKLIQVELISS